jgi:hypothetical protein
MQHTGICNWDISVSIATKLWAEWPGTWGSIACKGEVILFSRALRTVLGPISANVQRLPSFLAEYSGRGVKLTTYLHLLSK